MNPNTSGVLVILLGIGVSLNFIISGPHAYGSGLAGVIVGVMSGVVLILVGIYLTVGGKSE